MSQTPDTPPPATFRARCTDDLVAMVPIAIGFHPELSVVMLTFGGPRPFHARVDLPEEPDHVEPVVATLLAPARRHEVERVAFLLYGPDDPLVLPLATRLRDRFEVAGFDVLDVVRVEADRWFAVLPGHPASHYVGVPCDPTTHPFTARAVVDGHVTLGSRDEVRRSVDPDPAAVARCRALLAAGPRPPLAPSQVVEVVTRCVGSRERASDPEVVALARAVGCGAVRDLVWGGLEQRAAPAHVDFWRDVVRRLPEELVASPAAVLAFCAWLAGDGALAWCAVDRAEASEPGHSLAGLVSDLLATATPPSAWTALRAGLDRPEEVQDGVTDPVTGPATDAVRDGVGDVA